MVATFYIYWNDRPTFFVHTSLVLEAYLFGSTFWMDYIKAFHSMCTGNLWWQVLCLALGMQRPVCGGVCHRLLGDTQKTHKVQRAIIHSTCLLSTKHCAEDTAMKKTHKNLCLQEV